MTNVTSRFVSLREQDLVQSRINKWHFRALLNLDNGGIYFTTAGWEFHNIEAEGPASKLSVHTWNFKVSSAPSSRAIRLTLFKQLQKVEWNTTINGLIQKYTLSVHASRICLHPIQSLAKRGNMYISRLSPKIFIN